MQLSLLLSAIHILWTIYWGRTYSRIRRARAYADGRQLADTNKRYKIIGYTTFFTHNVIGIASYWSDAPWLLKIHHDDRVKIAGILILGAATTLHASAIKHLGSNYSPCFDSHLPNSLVTTGPYKLIRHPDYLAKLIVSLGLVFMTGSSWALGLFVWLAFEVARSIAIEERTLASSLPGYTYYQQRTSRLVPFIF